MSTEMVDTEHRAYDEICCDTMTRGDAYFIHQHVVDAFAAQSADATTKPVGLWFALVGLFLFVEHQYSGRQVQQMHMRMARLRVDWQPLDVPSQPGSVTAQNVIDAGSDDRDSMIRRWCDSEWTRYAAHRDQVVQWLDQHGLFADRG